MCATAFLLMLGLGVLFPVLPFYVRWLRLSEFQAGLLIACYAGMSVLTAPLWGRFSQRFGRKPAILIGLIGFSVGFGLFSIGSTFAELLGARILGGFFAAAAMPAIFAYAADVSRPESRAQAMGAVGASIGLGVLVGPVIGGLLSPLGLRVPFMASSAIGAFAAVAVAFGLPESRVSSRDRAEPGRSMQVARRLAPYLLVAFGLQTARMALESTIGFVAGDRVGANARDVGLLLGALGVIAVAVQGGIRPLSARFGDRRLLLTGIVLGAIGLVGIGRATSWPAFYATGGVLSFGFALVLPSFNAILSRAAEDVQGEAQGLKSSAESLGRVVGPLVFTAGYQAVGAPLPFAGAGALCLLAGILAFAAVGRREG
ncbi:MAG: MFS transporter [Myxococcota bacterium]